MRKGFYYYQAYIGIFVFFISCIVSGHSEDIFGLMVSGVKCEQFGSLYLLVPSYICLNIPTPVLI